MGSTYSDTNSSNSEDGNRHHSNDDNCEYGSSCGIKTVNEQFDKFTGKQNTKKIEHSTGNKALHRKGNAALGRGSLEADAQIGPLGGIAEGSAEISYFTFSKQEGKIDVLKAKAGGDVGAGLGGVKAKVECGVDLISTDLTLGEDRSINANLGLNADTGVEYGVDGFSVSAGGFGFSIGRNTGVSMPFGSASLKWW